MADMDMTRYDAAGAMKTQTDKYVLATDPDGHRWLDARLQDDYEEWLEAELRAVGARLNDALAEVERLEYQKANWQGTALGLLGDHSGDAAGMMTDGQIEGADTE